MKSFACVLIVAVLMTAAAPAEAKGATAGRPGDYRKITGLSPVVYSKTVRQSYMLPMADGVSIYVEVTRPKAKGRFPVIAEISPYHGTAYVRNGWRMLPDQDGLVKYFVRRGYAVLMMDVRGTGRSQGCLDHIGPNDASDAKEVVEWAAKRNWSNGRVGAIGHSYPAGTAVMTLAQRPKGLATIVASAGIGSMYEHQFQAGVPYNFQWAGPMYAYYGMSLERHMPVGFPFGLAGSGNGGDNFGKDMQYFGCGATNSSLVAGEAQLSGQYVQWHRERDFRKGAAANPIPVFAIHSVNDEAARVAALEWFLRRNGKYTSKGKNIDKLWLGQWSHGVGCCPNRRGYQWTKALHAWFDRHLKSRDVDTGPPVELFLSDGARDSAMNGDRTEIFTADAFPGRPRMWSLYPDDEGLLASARPKREGSRVFSGTFFGERHGDATFRTRPFGRNYLLAGMPELDLASSVTMPRVHLIATVYDEDRDGDLRRITQFAINPELRNGIDTITPVVPFQEMKLHPPGFAMAHRIKKGHRIVLRVSTEDNDKVPLFSVDPWISIHTGRERTVLHLPVVDDPVVYSDKLNLTVP